MTHERLKQQLDQRARQLLKHYRRLAVCWRLAHSSAIAIVAVGLALSTLIPVATQLWQRPHLQHWSLAALGLAGVARSIVRLVDTAELTARFRLAELEVGNLIAQRRIEWPSVRPDEAQEWLEAYSKALNQLTEKVSTDWAGVVRRQKDAVTISASE